MKPSSAIKHLYSGFTLVELISVLVILGVVAVIGSSFLLVTVDSYSASEKRAKMIAKGRVAIEQMTRQLRNALPNAVRVSASGNCLEFMPIVGGANYLSPLPDAENGAASISTITTSPFILGLGSAQHVVVAPLFSTEVYTNATTASRVAIGPLGASPYTSVALAASHRFVRNSINRRLFITDNPKRFCVTAGSLMEYSSYGVPTGVLSDGNPGGASHLVASGTSANGTAFQLSPGSEDRNTAINISLNFSDRGEQVALNNRVLIRNVP